MGNIRIFVGEDTFLVTQSISHTSVIQKAVVIIMIMIMIIIIIIIIIIIMIIIIIISE